MIAPMLMAVMQWPGCLHLRGGDDIAASSPIIGVEREANMVKATCANVHAAQKMSLCLSWRPCQDLIQREQGIY